MFKSMDIIMNLILDVSFDGFESFPDSSEWTSWMFWPGSRSSINNMIDLLFNTFVRNFFLGIKSLVKSKLS